MSKKATNITVNPINIIRRFIQLETAGGILLFSAAIIALILDNTPWQHYYTDFFQLHLVMELGITRIAKPLIAWVNDGLMSIFFLLVGLEIKREIFQGELNSFAKIVLPGIAAVGGMLAPALIYIAFNHHDPVTLHGWAIPTATDIAFALGIMSLLRGSIPISLKIFLTAVAIFDDVGAIVIIAAFYTSRISVDLLLLAIASLLILVLMNRVGVKRLFPYFFVGFILWLCVLHSGVHATLAGVALAFAIPLKRDKHGVSPLRYLEDKLHPWVAFFVLPVFGFANAGVSFQGLDPTKLISPLTLGIAGGLFVGKQIGIFGASWLAVRTKIAKLPSESTWLGIYGVALICGVGFTMSLFISGLAFQDVGSEMAALSRFGILCGSLFSGAIGYLFLRFGCPSKASTEN